MTWLSFIGSVLKAILFIFVKLSLLRLDPDEKSKLDEQDSIILNSTLTSPITKIELPTKSYIDSLHDKNERSRRDLSLDFYDESSMLLKFNQTLQNYWKVSVGDDTYNLTKYDKIQITDTTVIKKGNGQYLLPRWKVICNDKNNNGVTTNFIRATKTNSPTGHSGATYLPPFGTAFMYIETSSNNHGHERIIVSWERTDIIQSSKISFYYNRFTKLNIQT